MTVELNIKFETIKLLEVFGGIQRFLIQHNKSLMAKKKLYKMCFIKIKKTKLLLIQAHHKKMNRQTIN